MKRPIKLFEPVTDKQIKRLHSKARETGLPKTEMYKMVTDLVGISSITALSKQEAIFLIDLFQGQTKSLHPGMPLFENKIGGNTSSLPSYYHIRDIRLMFQELGWDKDQMKSWLIKYRKVKDIRSMDRKQARTTYSVLKGMVERN